MTMLGPFSPVQGLNSKSTIFTVPKNQATAMSDFIINYGSVVTRGSSFILNASPLNSSAPINGLTTWTDNTNDSGNLHLIAIAGSKAYNALWSQDNSTLTFNDVTGSVSIAPSANQLRRFDSLNNILVCVGGAGVGNVPLKLPNASSGNFSNLGGSPPQSNSVIVCNNIMFLANSELASSSVYWSNVSDPETWGASNFLNFRNSDGDYITALGNFSNDLIIFKRNSIGRLSTQTIVISGTVTLGPLTTISNTIGCAGAQCVDNLPDGRLVFLGANYHLYIYDGSIFSDVSDQEIPGPSIQPSLDVIAHRTATTIPNVCLKVYPTKNQIWISVPSDAAVPPSSGTVYIYNYIDNSWTSSTGIKANVFAIAPPGRANAVSGYPYRIISGDYAGNVIEQDFSFVAPTDDSGSLVTPSFTMSFYFSGESSEFIPRSSVFPLTSTNGGSISVTFGFDGTMNGSPTYTSSSGVVRNIVTIPYKNNQNPIKPFSLQIQFSTSVGTAAIGPFYLSDEVLN